MVGTQEEVGIQPVWVHPQVEQTREMVTTCLLQGATASLMGQTIQVSADPAMPCHVINCHILLCQLMTSHGQGDTDGKMDIKHAYRNIPVHPQEYLFLGTQWKGHAGLH